MGMNSVASRNSTKTLTATGASGALTVASGEPVTVYGISLYAGTGNAIFTITDGSDTTLSVVGVLSNSSISVEVCWKADAGIKVQINAVSGAPNVTVYHESPGN